MRGAVGGEQPAEAGGGQADAIDRGEGPARLGVQLEGPAPRRALGGCETAFLRARQTSSQGAIALSPQSTQIKGGGGDVAGWHSNAESQALAGSQGRSPVTKGDAGFSGGRSLNTAANAPGKSIPVIPPGGVKSLTWGTAHRGKGARTG